MNSKNMTWFIGVVFAITATVAGVQMNDLKNSVAEQKSTNKTITTQNTQILSENEELTKELGDLKSKYGVALTDKESASKAADLAKADANTQKQKVATVTSDRDSAYKAAGSLMELAKYMNIQRGYYKQAVSDILSSLSDSLKGDFTSGSYYIGEAQKDLNYAAQYDNYIDNFLKTIQ